MELSARTTDRRVCAPVVGICNHTFHKDCITSWIKSKSNHQCPVCKQFWQIKKQELIIKKPIKKTINIPTTTLDENHTPTPEEYFSPLEPDTYADDMPALEQVPDDMPELEPDTYTDNMPALVPVSDDDMPALEPASDDDMLSLADPIAEEFFSTSVDIN